MRKKTQTDRPYHATLQRCRNHFVLLARVAKVPTGASFASNKGYDRGFFWMDLNSTTRKARLTFVYPNTGMDNISPGLPPKKMMEWLDSFGAQGLKAEWKKRKERK